MNAFNSEIYVVGATNAPRLAAYKLSTDRNSFVQTGTLDPGFSVTCLAAAQTVLAVGGATKLNTVTLGRTTLLNAKTAINQTPVALVVAPAANFLCFDDGTGLLNCLPLSGGQAINQVTSLDTGISGTFMTMTIASSGTRFLGGTYDGVTGGPQYASLINGVPTTLYPAGGGGNGGDPMLTAPWPALGSSYAFEVDTQDASVVRLNATTITEIGSALTGLVPVAVATHPSQPWAYAASGAAIKRFTGSTSTITANSTTVVPGTTLAIVVTAAGDRLIQLTSSKLYLYSIDSTGGLTAITSQTLTNSATSLVAWPL